MIDPELEAILKDYCKKAGIRLKKMKVLKEINEVRKELWDDYDRL